MSLKTAVLYGSVRYKRQGIKGARFIVNQLEKRNHSVAFIDPQEYQLPLLHKMYKQYPEGKAPEPLEKIAAQLRSSHGYVIVSGEYNHGVPPALKNLLDHFQREYYFKPSAIASYSAGNFGGVRGAMSLRAILAELGMSSIPSIFAMSKVQDAFDENGAALEKAYEKRITRFLDEYEWYARALKKARQEGTPY